MSLFFKNEIEVDENGSESENINNYLNKYDGNLILIF